MLISKNLKFRFRSTLISRSSIFLFLILFILSGQVQAGLEYEDCLKNVEAEFTSQIEGNNCYNLDKIDMDRCSHIFRSIKHLQDYTCKVQMGVATTTTGTPAVTREGGIGSGQGKHANDEEYDEESSNTTQQTTTSQQNSNTGSPTTPDDVEQTRANCLQELNVIRDSISGSCFAESDEVQRDYRVYEERCEEPIPRKLSYSTIQNDFRNYCTQHEVSKIKQEYSEEAQQCRQAQMVAAECCGHPEKCFTKPDVSGENDSNASTYMQIGQMLAGTALNMPAGSVEAMCGKMKTISQLTTGVNLYLAQRCTTYVGQCKKACIEPAKRIRAKPACKDGACDDVIAQLEFELNVEDCNLASNGAVKQANQAIASAAATKYADMCKKQAKAESAADITADVFGNPNCTTPGAASSPICQAKCSRPGAASDPNCAGFPGLGNANTGANELAGNTLSTNPFGDLVPETEGQQGPMPEDTAATPNQSTGGQGGGGSSGGLGGGGDGGGGTEGGAQGPGGGEGYNTGILKGTMSGNGYSSSGGALRTGASGGFSGYGGKGAITANARPFNLKDFLPGGAKTKNLAMRGIASTPSDISPAHSNIFQKVTDRFYEVCLRNALYDCATLKKVKKSGN